MAFPTLRQYDVFISFRGQDTRQNFTSHLFAAFRRKGVDAFSDNELRRGNDLSRLLEHIDRSKIAVIIFSENFANSRWCLEELVKIVDRWGNGEMAVLPIFYKVSPSDVRYQSGSFGAPFESAEEVFRRLAHKVPIWKTALAKVSDLAGRVLLPNSRESDFIEGITRDILKMLNDMSSTENVGLFGIEPRCGQLREHLRLAQSNGVQVVGVLGMVGMGKTTVADIVYQRIYCLFDGCCFMANIRTESERVGLNQLQKKLLCKILDDDNLEIGAPETAHEKLKNRLGNKRVLIVLDDVNDERQVDLLIGQPEWFGEGTRIIITTRDKKLIKNMDETYVVPRLSNSEAWQLFSLNAFNANSLPGKKFMDMSNRFLDYAKGNPWIIKLLGKDLRDKDIMWWTEKLDKLQSSPDGKVQRLLRICYEELNTEQKYAFLDVACFFRSENVDYVKSLLDTPSMRVSSAISDLTNKFLISISDNCLEMHDFLHTMGKQIILEASVNAPGKRCRLWNHEDIVHVLKNETGTEEIRGMFLDFSAVRKMSLSPDVFRKMCNLKFLKFYSSHCSRGCEKECKFRFPNGLNFLSDALTYLHWEGFPLEYLPPSFDPSRLVDVNLRYSHIERLWEDDKDTGKLKWIDLSHSRNLLNLSGLSEATNLERLNLEKCTGLVEISSVRNMNSLLSLNLRGCMNLESLPDGINLMSLKILILSGCNNLKKFPLISENIESLFLDGTSVRRLPKSIGNLSKLALLNLKNCKKLKYLPESLCKLKSLQELILSGCSRLESFPEIKEDMERLEILLLDETTVKEMPQTLHMSNLKTFSFCRSKGEDPVDLLLPSQSRWSHLTDLYLTDCGLRKLPDDVSFLSSLQCLCLSRNDFESIPASIEKLYLLKWLDLKYCKHLISLPVLPQNLQYLDAHECSSLESLASPLTQLMVAERIPSIFIFTNCFRLKHTARESIMFHLQIKSQLMANPSLKRYHQGIMLEPLVSLCFPGTEIPLWFHHQGMGYKVKTKLPPHWCDSRFLGFALSAVVSFKDSHAHNARFSVKCQCKIENQDDEWIVFSFTLGGWNEPCRPSIEPRQLGSDHVFFSYNNCFHITKSCGEDKLDKCSQSTASFRFLVSDDTKRKLECCEVTKCGLSLLYSRDEEDGRALMIQDTSIDQGAFKKKRRSYGHLADEIVCTEVQRHEGDKQIRNGKRLRNRISCSHLA